MMAPKAKCVGNNPMRRKLRDEPSGDEQNTPLSDSLGVLEVTPDLEATVPQTKSTA